MHSNRVKLLAGIFGLLVVWVLWGWISSWGLVTVNVREQPLSKVLSTISRQSGVQVLSDLEPESPVTLRVEKVPLAEAMESLAVQLDASWIPAVVGAENKQQVRQAIQLFQAKGSGEGWVSYHAPMFGAGFASDAAIDPRKVEWEVSPVSQRQLQNYLEQAAQKTGVLVAVPENWNPVLRKDPASGNALSALTGLIKQAGGKSEEVVLLRRGWRGRGPGRQVEGQPEPPPMMFASAPGRRQGNMEWMAERVEAAIQQLPAEEQAAARKDANEMRAFWQSVRDLPEEERREKIQEMMESPQMQERMQERFEIRDSRSTTQRREQRMRNYVERKEQIKNSQQPQ